MLKMITIEELINKAINEEKPSLTKKELTEALLCFNDLRMIHIEWSIDNEPIQLLIQGLDKWFKILE